MLIAIKNKHPLLTLFVMEELTNEKKNNRKMQIFIPSQCLLKIAQKIIKMVTKWSLSSRLRPKYLRKTLVFI